ncbi:hypothetical protein THAOC_13788 [Thalassiosira oceanica]|uniref:Uncharacterized protein n=1 Tax=Thalassiosira oceanica TaxID=159749 RepID=K0SGQ2_THAOC|nr:hypothetical protein THAOC_13788 [Thalassiosira oceanica]|eukprot:EJK65358.1 hypothetical protein THAOC_13788 [Thalassiosira oceanica]
MNARQKVRLHHGGNTAEVDFERRGGDPICGRQSTAYCSPQHRLRGVGACPYLKSASNWRQAMDESGWPVTQDVGGVVFYLASLISVAGLAQVATH